MNKIYYGDNLEVLRTIPSESVNLIYIDPPFNTGKKQKRNQLKTKQSDKGNRKGYAGKTYETEIIGSKEYDDSFDDFYAFIKPRLDEAYRVLAKNGSLYFHIDYREAHYCKMWLDQIFGRKSFLNEIIWSYDYGARSKKKWPAKHDNIFWYAKNPKDYIFNYHDIDRIPYLAPELVEPEKAAKGKTPTDVWFLTIVPTNSKEKTGYPTQKPRKLLDRIIKASSNKGDLVLDFFAGSGTTGESCLHLDRKFILIDKNKQAIEVMKSRFNKYNNIEFIEFNI